jgi:hypothetical protein
MADNQAKIGAILKAQEEINGIVKAISADPRYTSIVKEVTGSKSMFSGWTSTKSAAAPAPPKPYAEAKYQSKARTLLEKVNASGLFSDDIKSKLATDLTAAEQKRQELMTAGSSTTIEVYKLYGKFLQDIKTYLANTTNVNEVKSLQTVIDSVVGGWSVKNTGWMSFENKFNPAVDKISEVIDFIINWNKRAKGLVVTPGTNEDNEDVFGDGATFDVPMTGLPGFQEGTGAAEVGGGNGAAAKKEAAEIADITTKFNEINVDSPTALIDLTRLKNRVQALTESESNRRLLQLIDGKLALSKDNALDGGGRRTRRRGRKSSKRTTRRHFTS